MFPLTATIIMSLILMLAAPTQAELWRCTQPGGPDLFTDKLRDPGTCDKYSPSADLSYVSGLPPLLPRMVPREEARADDLIPQTDDWREDFEPVLNPDEYPSYYEDFVGGYWGVVSPRFFLFQAGPSARSFRPPATPRSRSLHDKTRQASSPKRH